MPASHQVLYPFVQFKDIEAAATSLRNALRAVKLDKLTLVFPSLGHFRHRVVFLEPSNAPKLQTLHKICASTFPKCMPEQPKKGNHFHAHLTVGQFKKSAAQEFLANHTFVPCHYVFREILILTRATMQDPMQVHTRIPLGPEVSKYNPDFGIMGPAGDFADLLPFATEPRAQLLVHSERPKQLLEVCKQTTPTPTPMPYQHQHQCPYQYQQTRTHTRMWQHHPFLFHNQVRLPLAQSFTLGKLPRPASKKRLLIFVLDKRCA